jgi:3-oxoacyl-[acyl-carrier protein] reductase
MAPQAIQRPGVIVGRLENKVCIVTGTAGSVGGAVARLFGREGAIVVSDGDEPFGNSGQAVATDLSSRESVFALAAATTNAHGRIDVLVNAAAGVVPTVPLEEKTDAMFDAAFSSTYYPTLWTMQAVFPWMRDQGGGSVVNFMTRASGYGQWNTADQNAAAASLIGLTNNAAAEWAKHRILCNIVSPLPSADGLASAVPLGRVPDPEADIAPVALFLASDDALFITGSIINVDGGYGLAPAAMVG